MGILAFTFVSCDNNEENATILLNTEWHLVEIIDGVNGRLILSDTADGCYNIRFYNNKITGIGKINEFSGTYTLNNNLSIHIHSVTEVGTPDEIGNLIFKYLNGIKSFQIVNNNILRLYYDDGIKFLLLKRK